MVKGYGILDTGMGCKILDNLYAASAVTLVIISVFFVIAMVVGIFVFLGDTGGFSEIHITRYPGSEDYELPQNLCTAFNIPLSAQYTGYTVNVSKAKIAEWYQEQLDDWSLMRENEFPLPEYPDDSAMNVLFEQAGTGLFVFVISDFTKTDHTVYGVASGPWAMMQNCGQIDLDALLKYISAAFDTGFEPPMEDTGEDDAANDDLLPELSFTYLEFFPVELTQYQETVDIAQAQEDIIAGVPALITPYMMHYGTVYPEGTGQWYVYPHGTHFEVVAPAHGAILTAEYTQATLGNPTVVNGTTTYQDIDLMVYLDATKRMNLGQIHVLKSVIDSVQTSATGYLLVQPGMVVGYTDDEQPLRITMWDENMDNGLTGYFSYRVCPLTYYTAEIKEKLTDFYDTYVYESMKPVPEDDPEYDARNPGGCWPESQLCSPVNINIDDSIWGTWYYKSGYRDTSIPSNASGYNFRSGILVFLKRDVHTNPETFAYAWSTTRIEDECPNWEGLYTGVYDGITTPADYQGCYVRPTSDSHVKALLPFNIESSHMTFMRYSFEGDDMEIQFFDTFLEAQNDFTDSTAYTKNKLEGNPLP